jgi:hypothetical protein
MELINRSTIINRSTKAFGPESKEPKVKDPETFQGLRDTLNAFLTECELIFELQPSRFVDDRTKVSFMISLHDLTSPRNAASRRTTTLVSDTEADHS